MAIKVRHDPANAIDAQAAITQYVNAVETGELDADDLVTLVHRALESLEAESYALNRALGR